ncbi:MAG: hypothetical protein HPZ91_19160 [Lentisphaeria bacterium]|nr:hypothetical protein [Lentisphaeria bacterium]
MSSWLYDPTNSMVDFMAFCFALNTMFSFSRIQRRMTMSLWTELVDCLDRLRPHIEDCEAEMKKLNETEKAQLEECLQLTQCYDRAINQKKSCHEFVRKVFQVFRYIFMGAATVSALCLVFSRMPFLTQCHLFTLMLFAPTIAFFLFSAWYRFWVISRKVAEINKEVKEKCHSLEQAKRVMHITLAKFRNPPPEIVE